MVTQFSDMATKCNIISFKGLYDDSWSYIVICKKSMENCKVMLKIMTSLITLIKELPSNFRISSNHKNKKEQFKRSYSQSCEVFVSYSQPWEVFGRQEKTCSPSAFLVYPLSLYT